MLEHLHIFPDEPCPEVAAGRCSKECTELKELRKIQKTSGRVQAMCRQCGRIVTIAPEKDRA